MKTRIIQNKPAGSYTEEFILNNSELVKDWEFADLYENNFISPFWNGTSWIDNATPEQITEVENKKIKEYSDLIWSKTRALNLSAKKRVLDKLNENLTFEDLTNLEKKYKIKGEIALGILTGSVNSGNAYDLIVWEQLNDFPTPKLNATINFLNQNYNANIEITENDLFNYCKLILFKVASGEYMSQLFENLIENFRSKLLTNLREKEFSKIDERINLVDTINNQTNLTEIEILKTNFDNI